MRAEQEQKDTAELPPDQDDWLGKLQESFQQRLSQDEEKDTDTIRREERSTTNLNLVLSLSVAALFLLWSYSNRERMTEISKEITSHLTSQFGWFFVLLSSTALIYLMCLAFSRFGDVVLGEPEDQPEFSNISWYSMLFSAGMGVGILFWGAAEPLTHYLNNPLTSSKTVEAARSAMAITLFHWGFHGWGVYTLCACAVAYYGFRKRKSYLISSAITGLCPIKALDRPLALLVDLTATIAIVFGLAASLSTGTQQFAAGLEATFGLEAQNAKGYLTILAFITVAFMLSATTGLKKGIRILSNLNMATCTALLATVFIFGPTLFQLKLFVDSIGIYASRLTEFSFQVAPFTPEYEQWMSTWTVSYFTWWIAWAPFVGIFVARISRGRTIKELILASLFIPVGFTIFWFAVFGGTALQLVMNGDQEYVQLIESGQAQSSLFYLLAQLPLASVTKPLSLFLIFTFLVTSADSACFVLAMMTSEGNLEPSIGLKALWAVVMASLTGFLVKDGTLAPIQAAAQSCAGPFALVLVLLAISLPLRLRHQVQQKRI